MESLIFSNCFGGFTLGFLQITGRREPKPGYPGEGGKRLQHWAESAAAMRFAAEAPLAWAQAWHKAWCPHLHWAIRGGGSLAIRHSPSKTCKAGFVTQTQHYSPGRGVTSELPPPWRYGNHLVLPQSPNPAPIRCSTPSQSAGVSTCHSQLAVNEAVLCFGIVHITNEHNFSSQILC